MAIKDLDDLEVDSKKNKSVEKFIKSADMTKIATKKKATGRPKKKEEDKSNYQVFINLTEEQKAKLTKQSDDMGVSVSAIVKMILAKEGII